MVLFWVTAVFVGFSVVGVIPITDMTGYIAAGIIMCATLCWFLLDRIVYPDRDVDIWKHQRHLMSISGQHLPRLPEINKDVLLYFALTLEELEEAGHTLRNILTRISDKAVSANGLEHRHFVLRDAVHAAMAHLDRDSKEIRRALRHVEEFTAPLTRNEAVALLDDSSDIAVVHAGFGLSAGLPVRAGYTEVALSNASKANPNTGMIDKDPSGKWIKGPKYFRPNLNAVVEDHWRAYGGE